jgi:hypothetical protein
LRRVALFAYFPTVRAPRGPTSPLLSSAHDEDPDLHADLVLLESVLFPTYERFDQRARLEQNRHRRQQVLLIVGGLLTTVFGAVQAAAATQAWPGIVVSGVGAATAAVASVGRQSGALDGYLANRLKAERLRSTAFTFLAGSARSEGTESGDPECWLRDRVTGISYEQTAGPR